MIIENSKHRSDELTNKAQNFLKFKLEYFDSLYQKERVCPKEKLLDYFKVGEDKWNDWEWQLKNRITKAEQLKCLVNATEDELYNIKKVSQKFRWAITPYYLSQIRTFDVNDPIYLQSIPQIIELDGDGQLDPMNEANTNPVGIITRRYPDRVILNVTNCCASFCRHCQRRRNIGEFDFCASESEIDKSLTYIEEHPEIRDVLITGGDPLTLSDDSLESLLRKIRAIKTVEIVRIGTRTLVTLPQRITDGLIAVLKKYIPIYINTQFNHPQEITEETIRACLNLSNNGIVLGNQMVFLKGINDNSNVLQLLNQLLLKQSVRPYYIFHPKDIVGTKHFSISIKNGLEIYNKLRGNTSGLAIPTYVFNASQGLGKIPLSTFLLEDVEEEKNKVSLKTWEHKTINVDLNSIL